MDLKQSKVQFFEQEHRYTLGDKELKGVTPIVSWLLPETYKDIPKVVLDKAAARGKLIHDTIEIYDDLGETPKDFREVEEYIRLMKENNLTALKSEYMVSDEKNIASKIDKLALDKDNGIVLIDLKATSEIHYPNLQAQLSIYAYLFELNNPTLKVKTLACIWLPREQYSKHGVYLPIERVDTEIIKAMIVSYLNGEDNTPYRQYFNIESKVEIQPTYPHLIPIDVEAKISELIVAKEKVEEEYERMKTMLREAMSELALKTWEGQMVRMTITAPSTRASFNTTQFKKDYPELFQKYTEQKTTKESIRLTNKK